MKPAPRKLALTVHLVSSVGWIGAVVGFLVLVVAALWSQNTQTMRAVWVALELTGWFAIVPLSLVALLSGFVLSLGTSWGLLRHYWVVFKLLLSVLATLVLLINMQTVSAVSKGVAQTGNVALSALQSELLHAGGGMLVLLVTTILSVYKPRGMTRFGRQQGRKQLQTLQS